MKFKVFEWCDGLGIDLIFENWRSRILMDYGGSMGYSSCSIVGWIGERRKFVEVLVDYNIWEYYRKVYEVKFEGKL